MSKRLMKEMTAAQALALLECIRRFETAYSTQDEQQLAAEFAKLVNAWTTADECGRALHESYEEAQEAAFHQKLP